MGDFSFLSLPAESRLAFRELGLSIGFAGLDRIEQEIQAAASRRPFAPELPSMMAPLKRYRLVKDEINAFWMVPLNRDAETWTAHRDISQVMLATALAPQGFLGL
jgi:hypothetical protein